MVTAIKPGELETAAPVSYRLVPLASIVVRPDLFQWRDEGGKEGRDDEQVTRLVREWDWERYDPLTVVRSPDNPDSHIVIGGHHRFDAMSQLVGERPAEFTNVQVRVLQGDVNDPEDRQRLVNQAILSNYGVHGTSLFADVKAAQEFKRQGLSARQIADRMNIKRVSKVEDLLAFGNLAQHVQQRVQIEPALYPMAAELGRAMDRGMTQDEASGFFNIWVMQYQENQELPSPTVIRNILRLQAQKKAAGEQATFVGSQDFIAAYQGMIAENDAMERELTTLRRRLAACERLEEVGTDVSAVSAAAQARIEALESTLAARRSALLDDKGDGELVLPTVATTTTAPPPAPAPAPTPTPTPDATAITATDMWGNTVTIQTADDEEPEDEPPPFVQAGPGLFGAPADDDGDGLPSGRYVWNRATQSFERVGDTEELNHYHGTALPAGAVIEEARLNKDIKGIFVRPIFYSTPDPWVAEQRAQYQAAGRKGFDEQIYSVRLTPEEVVDLGYCDNLASKLAAEQAGFDVIECSQMGNKETLSFDADKITIVGLVGQPAEPEPPPIPDAMPVPTAERVVVGQATMGDDFATNQTLGMAMPMPAVSEPAAPLIAPEPLRAAQERRQAVARGQMEIPNDVPVPSVSRQDVTEQETIPELAGRAKRVAQKGKVVPPKKSKTGKHDSLRSALLKRGRR